MRDKVRDNNGYTLVEMIIVIAIIAILSGMGFITVGAIKTSQATASMQKFDDELSGLEMRTKTQSLDTAIKIEQNGANYNVFYGTYNGTTFELPAANKTAKKPDVVLERVTIYYDSGYDSDSASAPLTDQIIQIRKSDGQVISGFGEYKFTKYNSSDSVGRVTLNKFTGAHTYGKN